MVPDITVYTSVFVYPLMEKGLPTHVGILDGTLAVRMELGGLSEIISDYDTDDGYGVLTEFEDVLQCSDGKGGTSCMKLHRRLLILLILLIRQRLCPTRRSVTVEYLCFPYLIMGEHSGCINHSPICQGCLRRKWDYIQAWHERQGGY